MPLVHTIDESENAGPYSASPTCETSSSDNLLDSVEQQRRKARSSHSSLSSIYSDYQQEYNRPQGSQRVRDIWRDYWLWECSGCLFSFVCLAAVIGILAYEDGRQLSQWHSAIQPNAVISFIAILAKGALAMVLSQILSQLKWINFEDDRCLSQLRTFDFASRGPLGSFLLLWTSKRFLASMTAFLMLLTLLVDPFFQIVFTFPNITIADPTQKSTFSYSSVFDPMGGRISHRIDDRIVVGVHNGLNGMKFNESFECPSGFCKWPDDIKTLGVCGSCKNVTRKLQKQCFTTTIDQFTNKITCAYKFPSGQYEYATGWVHKDGEPPSNSTPIDSANFLSTIWNSTIIGNSTTRSNHSRSGHSKIAAPKHHEFNDSLIAFQVLRLFPVHGSAITLPPAFGYECRLEWCEKTFHHLNATGGHLHYKPEYQRLQRIEDPDGDNSYEYFSVPHRKNEPRSLNFSNTYPYKISKTNQLRTYLTENMVNFSYGGSMTARSFLLKGPESQLVESIDLNMTMANLGDSLTEMIRTTYNETKVLGRTMDQVVFIKVRWGFMALPLALLLYTSILLAVVALKSRSSRIAVWKDDPLALLFHHVDGVDQSLLPGRNHIGPADVENLADKIVVKLSMNSSLTFASSASHERGDSVASTH